MPGISSVCQNAEYEIEKLRETTPFWFTLLHASGIFLAMTFVVFFIVNYEFIESQLSDWWKERTFNSEYAYVRKKSDGEELASVSTSVVSFDNNLDARDSDGDKLSDFYEKLFGTDFGKIDSDSDGYNDYIETIRGYDPTNKEGLIEAEAAIPAAQKKFPILWVQRESLISENLSQGIVHYPESSFPGMAGNAVFMTERLPEGAFEKWRQGDEIVVYLNFSGGASVEVVYEIRYMDFAASNDPRILRNYDGHELTFAGAGFQDHDHDILLIKADLKKINQK